MHDLPPSSDRLLDGEELRELFITTGRLLTEVDTAQKAYIMRRLGETTYRHAESLLNLEVDDPVEVTVDVELELSKQDRQQDIERARSLLSEDPQDEEAILTYDAIKYMIERRFPEETVVSILNNDDALAFTGGWLRESDHQREVHSHPALRAFTQTEDKVEGLVSDLYADITGIRRTISVVITDQAFDFSYEDIPLDRIREIMQQADKTAIERVGEVSQLIGQERVDLRDGIVYLNKVPITSQSQKNDVTAMLRPLNQIATRLAKLD